MQGPASHFRMSNTTRVIVASCVLVALSAAALAQDTAEQARALVDRALSAWTAQESLCFHVTGTTTAGDSTTNFTATVWKSGPEKVRLQYLEGGNASSLILIIADGKSVWRWSQARKEYQQIHALGGGANLLALMSSLAPANATGALRLVMGDSDLVPAGQYFLTGSPPGTAAGTQIVQCSATKGVGKAETGTRVTFRIVEGETGPWLQEVRMSQTRTTSRSLARVSWRGSFVQWKELGPEGFTFVPPPGSRCVGVYESP
ncbi:MAG: hypothetical protein HRF45_02710 [Fimbriimonadia bacterium]